MTEEEIPDYNIFMMCESLDKTALSDLPKGFHFRNCRPDELELWKAFPFDAEVVPPEYEDFMNQLVRDSYSGKMETFFSNTLFACTEDDRPVATCSYWRAYDKFNAIHWLKTIKAYEGRGIGRAVLSEIMRRFNRSDYPILIHTQPGSFRAIKLYADFGFKLLRGGQLGTRPNELEKCLPILREFMSNENFRRLTIVDTPDSLIQLMEHEKTIQF